MRRGQLGPAEGDSGVNNDVTPQVLKTYLVCEGCGQILYGAQAADLARFRVVHVCLCDDCWNTRGLVPAQPSAVR